MKTLLLSIFTIFSVIAASPNSYDIIGRNMVYNDTLTAIVVFGVDEFSHGDEIFINAKLQIGSEEAKALGFMRKEYTINGFNILFALTHQEYLQVFASSEDIEMMTKAGKSLSYEDNICLKATGPVGSRTIELYVDNGTYKYDYSAKIVFENNRLKELGGKVFYYKNGFARFFKAKKATKLFDYTLNTNFKYDQGLATYSIDGFFGPIATTPEEIEDWIINGFEN